MQLGLRGVLLGALRSIRDSYHSNGFKAALQSLQKRIDFL
jgi:hypothetical protein